MIIDMTPNLMLVLAIGALVGCGIYLMLERSLSRVIIGIALIGNGVNLLVLSMGGRAGDPPLIGIGEEENLADPLPQAMILTAIVISLGFIAFMLAMAYRTWKLNGHDEVQDDLEDLRLAHRAKRQAMIAEEEMSLDAEAAEARDETEEDDAQGAGPEAGAGVAPGSNSGTVAGANHPGGNHSGSNHSGGTTPGNNRLGGGA